MTNRKKSNAKMTRIVARKKRIASMEFSVNKMIQNLHEAITSVFSTVIDHILNLGGEFE